MSVDRHGTAHHDDSSSDELVKQFDAAIERLSAANALQQSLPYSRLSVRYALAFRTFNPDNDSEQEWGQGIVTSNQDNGELLGEASLPFAQLASRLCFFHCGPLEKGGPADMPTEDVDRAKGLARDSWASGN